MDSPQKFKSTIAFTDLLFNILVGFVFLFLIAFLLINPIAKKGDIVVPAEYIITLTWPDDSADDIDIWMKGPNDEIVGFLNKSGSLIHLDRDDIGIQNDVIEIDNKEQILKVNREVMTIRGKMSGTYYISVHWYRKWSKIKSAEFTEDIKNYNQIPVTVEVQKVNPYRIVYKQTLIFDSEGQQQNYYKFTIDKNNIVQNISESDLYIIPITGGYNSGLNRGLR